MTKLRYQNIIDKMNTGEKVALCSGANNWITKAFGQYGIPSIRMADGPHGLRKQKTMGTNRGRVRVSVHLLPDGLRFRLLVGPRPDGRDGKGHR